MKLIDLSVLVENSVSEPMRITIKKLLHKQGARQFCRTTIWNKHLPLRIKLKNLWQFIIGKKRLLPKNFPDKSFLSLFTVTLPTHMGTHIDAPFHYGPEKDGKRLKTVDELPLEMFFQKAIRLDLRHKQFGECITQVDIEIALKNIGHELQPQEIVLIWTGTDKLWGKKEYFTHAPGMSREATDFLVKKGICVIGIDTYGFDRPFSSMLHDFFITQDNKHLWPAHFYGREFPYIQIERLANLELLPDKDFYISCFPLRIKDLDASWVRAVAILNL